MRVRTFLVLLLSPLLMLAALVPSAGPAAAAEVNARVCMVSGTVDVSPGVLRFPPARGYPGNYTFNQVIILCAGATAGTDGAWLEMTGVGSVTSSGAFGADNCGGWHVDLVSSFCGSYSASGFLAGPGCSGTVGGDETANLNPANVLANDWSVTFGPVISGGVTCDTMGEPFPLANVGVIAMVAVGNPLAIDGKVTVGSPSDPFPGECPEPPALDPAPLLLDPRSHGVWYCQIVVAGVVVMVAG